MSHGTESSKRRSMRMPVCMLLAVLLAACSYLGARPPETKRASVPVMSLHAGEEDASAETADALMLKREESIRMLQSVIEDETAKDEVREEAQRAQVTLALRADREAETEALLAGMGIEGATVVLSEASASVIVPWQAAANERDRLRIIDAAASQSGLSPECVKIILSKK